MEPSLLYHCPCNLGILEQAAQDGSSSTASTSSSSAIPFLPSQYSPANYSFHQLSDLYYCTECNQTRCQLCSQSEIVTHYCPACLFDVPSATVKAERNRCPRNCFLCPMEGCGSLLAVMASDPKDFGRMQAPEASLGGPPWFLFCQACRWDSKRAYTGGQGYVFEKSTGISTQVETQTGPSPGQLEMERLRSHYESHLRKQGSSAVAMASSATNKISKSKLLRDLPGLTGSKYLAGSRRGAALGLDKASAQSTQSDNVPPYTSMLSAVSTSGPLGRREEERRKFTAGLDPIQIHLTSGLSQRWSSGWDQGPTSNQHIPLRVPLQTLSTLRCPGCRHILVKPDLKRGNHRFKIALHASLLLPEIRIVFLGMKNRTSLDGGSSIGRKDSILNLRGNRPPSMFLSPSDAPSNLRHNTVRDEQQMTVSKVEQLQRGRSYDYEVAFVNPDLNAIAVHISVAQKKSSMTAKQEGLGRESGEEDGSGSRSPNPLWTVQLSTTRFTVKASDGLDIIDADLLNDLGLGEDGEDDAGGNAGEEEDLEVDDDGKGDYGTVGRKVKKGLTAGVLRREGNETVIGLRLNIGRGDTGQGKVQVPSQKVELALRVTFTTRQDPSEMQSKSKGVNEVSAPTKDTPTTTAAAAAVTTAVGSQNTHSFWTCVRLGEIGP